jgi:hypothetical protein
LTGWHTQVAGEYEKPTGVIGVVVAPKFPDLEVIRGKIEEGIARVAPETVWVVRERPQKNHAVNVVWQVLKKNGIEPLHVPLVPAWQSNEYDLRRHWADYELGNTCERVVVFHDASSNVTAEWKSRLCAAKVFVVERGQAKKVKRRTGRKPVGA